MFGLGKECSQTPLTRNRPTDLPVSASHLSREATVSESRRGTRLGAISYERDEQVAPAERLPTAYECSAGHRSLVPFSVEALEAEIPYDWTCRCGRPATRPQHINVQAKPERHVRTHWDMLLERRTIADLEELMSERLALLHAHQAEVEAEAKLLRRSA